MAESLIERLRAGDEDALAELYDAASRRAFGIAYQVLEDGAGAEDVVQDAFVEFWTAADRLDPARGRPEALLFTIVHRRAIDAVRARARRATVPSMPDVIDENATDLLDRAELGARPRAGPRGSPDAQS